MIFGSFGSNCQNTVGTSQDYLRLRFLNQSYSRPYRPHHAEDHTARWSITPDQMESDLKSCLASGNLPSTTMRWWCCDDLECVNLFHTVFVSTAFIGHCICTDVCFNYRCISDRPWGTAKIFKSMEIKLFTIPTRVW